jgi:hypothetical protein
VETDAAALQVETSAVALKLETDATDLELETSMASLYLRQLLSNCCYWVTINKSPSPLNPSSNCMSHSQRRIV